jgi:hypothetical protein
VERWKASGKETLAEYAPYAAYILSVEVFFQVALGAERIGTSLNSNRTDIAYLYYVLFCNLFVSTDRLHERCARLFLRPDQSFVWGGALKEDLGKLVQHYSALPREEQQKGVPVFAPTPPRDDLDCLVGKLWDQHSRPWRENRPALTEEMRKLLEPAIEQMIAHFADASEVGRDEIEGDLSNVGMITIERRISPKRGSFWMGPES